MVIGGGSTLLNDALPKQIPARLQDLVALIYATVYCEELAESGDINHANITVLKHPEKQSPATMLAILAEIAKPGICSEINQDSEVAKLRESGETIYNNIEEELNELLKKSFW